MHQRIISFFAFVLVVTALVGGNPASAEEKRSFITDAEVENTIRAYAMPLLQVAGLEPSDFRIYLVNDRGLNSFVAGGQRLFINTGLLMRSDNASQVIGVIAHEIGHIAGGHLARTQEALSNASAQTILAMVLGAATLIGGRPDMGQAVILGGANAAQRSFLQYSRTQEGEADQAAMKFLEATGQSSRGLLEFFNILGDQDLLSARYQDPYVRTHPLTRDRIEAVKAVVDHSRYADRPEPAAFEDMHRRMKAKLKAFLDPPAQTLREYPQTNVSIEARYARAIAYYRQPNLALALPAIDALIQAEPGNPYFHELRAQMLFENGRVAESLGSYEMSVRLKPDSYLLRIGLAQAQLEVSDDALLDPAIANLRMALKYNAESPFLWRQLAIAYGRKGDMGMSSLAMAEEAFYRGKRADARYHAERAEKLLPRDSPAQLRADDILRATEKNKD